MGTSKRATPLYNKQTKANIPERYISSITVPCRESQEEELKDEDSSLL